MLNGSSDPRKLVAVLERLKQRAEDAQADSDAGEGSAADAALGDVDPSLTAYNTAVLLYQLKQYSRCRTILEEMFSNIEPIDEFLVFRVCFLLLDVHLMQKQADKATEVCSPSVLLLPLHLPCLSALIATDLARLPHATPGAHLPRAQLPRAHEGRGQ